MFQTLAVEKCNSFCLLHISVVSFQIQILESVALNRNIHSTQIYIWDTIRITVKPESKDVKGQRSLWSDPCFSKCYPHTQTLRHQLGSGQKHRIRSTSEHLNQKPYSDKITGGIQEFNLNLRSSFQPVWSSGTFEASWEWAGKRLGRSDGEEARFSWSSLLLICWENKKPTPPPQLDTSHGHKGWRITVLDQSSRFLHAQLTTSK